MIDYKTLYEREREWASQLLGLLEKAVGVPTHEEQANPRTKSPSVSYLRLCKPSEPERKTKGGAP